MIRPIFILVFSLVFSSFSFAQSQSWIDALNGNITKNFYEIQKDFNDYAATVDLDTVRGWKQYKRWEWFMEPRVFPTGNFPNPLATKYAMEKYYVDRGIEKRSSTRSSGDWHLVGPKYSPGKGIGRINFVTFHPTEPNTIFVGAPSGGLWKSEDDGNTWVNLIDDLEVIGCSDLVINPLNPMTMYLASSDGDASDTYSLGVLKSTDGGKTWQSTGLDWNVYQARKMRKIIMHPNDTSTLYAATSAGIFKTTDAGNSWSLKQSGTFTDLEFKPGNPRVIYAARYGYSGAAGFYRSTDGGNSFQKITNGISPSTSIRFEIAVTPDDTNIVYVVVAKQSSNSLEGVYKSTDGGSSFTKVKNDTSPNLLGRRTNGTDLSTGQGWYDLCIIASPTNKDEVYVGGINIWSSSNGGTTWSLNAHWTGSGGAPYVHADIHAMEFYSNNNGSTFYVGCDGGLWKTTNKGNSYTAMNSGLAISQIYRLGISATDPDLLLIGLQDNGTKRNNTGSWDDVNGGDGFECIVDYADNNYMYASTQYGNIYRSTNKGNNFKRVSGSIPESGGWLTPYVMDPNDHKTLYAGYTNIYKSTNNGDSWTAITSESGSTKVDALAVAPSNSNVIYFAKNNAIWKTTDGGSNWTDISSGLPGLYITYIAVHPDYPDRIYVTLSGYTNGRKVYLSIDGGANWVNFSGSLPNLPANCIVYENGSDNGLYVGMDVGVYYRDSTMFDWVQFTNGIPNVIVNELEIYYNQDRAKSRIRAATYGRGVWESELYYPPNTPPVAAFAARDTLICIGYTNVFSNLSTNADSFAWFFPGGIPSVSNARNPQVRYDSAGTFDVTFIAYNDYGIDSVVHSSYIEVDPVMECSYIMPTNASGDLYTTCRGTLTDPGGNANYPDNLTSYITIAPPGSDKLVLIFEEFDMENNADSLLIYDGKGLKGTLLGSYTGNTLPGNGLVVTTTGAVTIQMFSDPLINKSGFVMKWRCSRTGEAPIAHFTMDNNFTCTGDVQFYLSDLGHIDNWKWDFGDGTTSTDLNPAHKYKVNGRYEVKLTVSNTTGNDSFIIDNLLVDLPDAPDVTPASVCGGGKVTLKTKNDGTIRWYGSQTGNDLIFTGQEFETPSLNISTTYYAERLTNGPSQYVGIANGTGDGSYSSSPNGLVFNALKDLKIVSVKIYTLGTGNRTILLLNANGDTLDSKIKNMINGEQTVILNFDVPAGNGYMLSTGKTSTMWRTKSGLNFPYDISGLISITNSISGTDYSFFYNWEVQEQNVCKSPRIPVVAGVFDMKPVADFTYQDSGIYVWFFDNSQNPFTYTWDFGDNETADEANPYHKYKDGGNFVVKLKVENGCGNDSINKTLNIVNSIREETKAFIAVYPNPGNGQLTITSNVEIISLTVYSAEGRMIKSLDNNIQSGDLNLNLELQKGWYLLKVVTDKGVMNQKIIIR